MKQNLTAFWAHTKGSMRDLAPIVIVILFFEFVVLQQIPDGLLGIGIGVALVVIGLTFFVYGLELALFPIGDALAVALAKKGSVFWLLSFSFLLGFGTTPAPYPTPRRPCATTCSGCVSLWRCLSVSRSCSASCASSSAGHYR
jgi:hypothetical protein